MGVCSFLFSLGTESKGFFGGGENTDFYSILSLAEYKRHRCIYQDLWSKQHEDPGTLLQTLFPWVCMGLCSLCVTNLSCSSAPKSDIPGLQPTGSKAEGQFCKWCGSKDRWEGWGCGATQFSLGTGSQTGRSWKGPLVLGGLQHVLMPGVASPQVKDPTFLPIELHKVLASPPPACWGPSSGSMAFWCVSHSFTEGALWWLMKMLNAQNWPLGYSAHYKPPTRLPTTDQHPLGPVIQPVLPVEAPTVTRPPWSHLNDWPWHQGEIKNHKPRRETKSQHDK